MTAAEKGRAIAPAKGKLGVLLPGMGAVATTFIAGVESARRGLARPIGSLTQMGTVRLGKRTEGRSPAIRELVPLASLEDLVFGGWDVYPDSAYESAKKAGVLEARDLEPIKDFLDAIKPWPAVFDPQYVKRLKGPNVKKGKSLRDLAEQVSADIAGFKKRNGLDRLVMVWCGSTGRRARSTRAWTSSRRASRRATRASSPR
jgi:myo-inositol-1-phosphate synthase